MIFMASERQVCYDVVVNGANNIIMIVLVMQQHHDLGCGGTALRRCQDRLKCYYRKKEDPLIWKGAVV